MAPIHPCQTRALAALAALCVVVSLSAAAQEDVIRPLCSDSKLREEMLAQFEGDRLLGAEWTIKTACAQLDLPRTPAHDAADPSPDASHSDWVLDAHFSADGASIVSASRDGTVRTWNAATGEPLRRIVAAEPFDDGGRLSQAIVRSVTYVGEGSKAVAASDGNPLRVIDLETGEIEATYDIPIDFFPPIIAGTMSGLLLAGGRRDDVEAIDIATGEVRLRLPGHAPGATAIAVSEPAGLIATAIDIDGQPARVQLWQLADGAPIGSIEIPDGRDVDALAFSRDGGRLAVATGGTAQVYTAGGRTKVGEIVFHPIFSGFDVAFTDDGKGLITCQSHPILWDIETGGLVRHFGPFSDLCHSLDVSPDGRFVVATSMGSDIRVWEIGSGAFHRRLGTNMTTQP